MRNHIARVTGRVLFVAMFSCLAGCPHRAPAPQAAEDWYRKPGLFDAFDTDATDLSLPNAYLLELACYIGDRGTFEVDRTLQTWGFDRRRDFRDVRTSTYGYVASNDRMVLVTFGGTDFLNVRDLLGDVDALQLVQDDRYAATSDARVHRGFRDGLNSVIDGVIDEVRRQARPSAAPATVPATRATTEDSGGATPGRTKKLFVAGHSRGGAFAVLAAAAFARAAARGDGLPPVGGVYTFGQPRVGNGPFVEGLEALRVPLFRFIHRDDPIPDVPPAGMLPQRLGATRFGEAMGYRHGGVAVRLIADGRVVRVVDEASSMANPNSAAGIGDHYQAGYYKAIYRALADPRLVEEQAWRATVSPGVVGALPRP